MKISGVYSVPTCKQLDQAMTVCVESVGSAIIRLDTGADGALYPHS